MNPVKWKPIALFVYKYGADKPDIYPASQYTWEVWLKDDYIEVWSIDGKERYEYLHMPAKIVWAAEPDEEKKEVKA